MVRPKHPCLPGCTERSATCHGTCERYSVYEQAMKQFYAEKDQIARGRRSNITILKNIDRQARRGKKGSSSIWGGE